VQVVVFNEGEEAMAVADQRKTELVAFFNFNSQPAERTKPKETRPRYIDMPEGHVYRKGEWKARKAGPPSIGRVHMPCVLGGEAIYLRILLHHDACRGAESFEQLKQECDTYKEACRTLGLLQDDNEWDSALLEGARTTRSGPQLRELYVTILRFCEPSDPRKLFDTHWTAWADDFKRQLGWLEVEDLSDHQTTLLRTLVLKDLEQRLQSWEVSLGECQLPVPTEEEVSAVQQQGGNLHLPAIVREELDFDFLQTATLARERLDLMTKQQRAIFDKLMWHVDSNTPARIFIDARGGCGKTFLLEAVLAAVRTSEPAGAVALAMGTTGLAANLLPLGRTFHSRMKVHSSPATPPIFRWDSTPPRKAALASVDRAASQHSSRWQGSWS